jgi:hypothetical protein
MALSSRYKKTSAHINSDTHIETSKNKLITLPPSQT